jgi:MFS transporter, PPP family, 3-phenylpropionic acid transporter
MNRNKEIWLAYLFMFVVFMPGAITAAFFPLYYKDIGYSNELYALQISLSPVVAIFSSYFWGYVSDKYQKLKVFMLVMAIAQILIISMLELFAQPIVIMITMLVFVFFQTGFGMLTETMNMFQVRALGAVFANIRGWGAAGYAFSSIIGGWIIKGMGSYDLIPWLVVFMYVLCLIMVICMVDPRKAEVQQLNTMKKARKSFNWRGILPYVRTSRFFLYMLALSVMVMALGVNDYYYSYLVIELGGTESDIGLGWAIPAIIEIGIFWWLGRNPIKRPLLMFITAGILYGIRAMLIVLTMDSGVMMAAQMITGVATALFLVAITEYAMILIPDEYRATGQAIIAFVLSIVRIFFVGMLGGWIYGSHGIITLYSVSAVLLFVSVGLFFIAYRAEKLWTNKQHII